MKRIFTIIALILSTFMLSCHKDAKKITLNTDLTVCPATQDCSFYYYDNTTFGSTTPIMLGSQRVFMYRTVSTAVCSMTTSLLFKIDLNASQFDISDSQIAAGEVVYGQSCTCCDFISVKPVGGEIKGERSDPTHWLVNAKVFLSSADKKFTDTLTVNQYFSANTLVTNNL